MLFEKTALVTGSGSKIAKSIIEQLDSSYLIIKHKLNYKKNYFFGDLSNEETTKIFFNSIKTRLDLMICCVGGIKLKNKSRPQPDDCIDISLSNVLDIFNTNFTANFLTCKYGIKKLKKNSDIIIIGSAVVSNPRNKGEVGIYACAKAAIHEYTIHLAKQLENTEKRVNCIATDGHDLKKINKCIENILNEKTSGKIFYDT